MSRPRLWLLITERSHPDVAYALPTVAWMAHAAGAHFDAYLACERSGQLFAQTGSTILGGRHVQQFNYLHAAFDVQVVLLGTPEVFASSLRCFNTPVLASAADAKALYAQLLASANRPSPSGWLVGPNGPCESSGVDLRPYLYPEIYFCQRLGLRYGEHEPLLGESSAPLNGGRTSVGLAPEEAETLKEQDPAWESVDVFAPGDNYATFTQRLAKRWQAHARGVAFGDPDMMLSLMPQCCREKRVALFAPKVALAAAKVRVAAYAEERSPVARVAAELAVDVGTPVIVGRQTGDGDIMEWSRHGVCIQIHDPDRPAFPIVSTVKHVWHTPSASLWDEEPDDACLRRYAREGKILATLLWHSGEVAHNEAMLNLCELAGRTGLKMGIGVHAARYETCVQLWELIHTARSQGGMRGLIEPVLHSGGMGVLAEAVCPPQALQDHAATAMERIRAIAGAAGVPRGYYAFLDAELDTLAPAAPATYRALEATGLRYVFSSALPGRNRILWQGQTCVALNQTPRCVCSASPFLRVTTVEELRETAPLVGPGWLVAALDSPVIAFDPYIWQHGARFLAIAAYLQQTERLVNVLPDTVARYARLLQAEGMLPAGQSKNIENIGTAPIFHLDMLPIPRYS